MALSDQISKLATRTKELEERAAAAHQKAHADLQQDVATAREESKSNAEALRQSVDADAAEVSAWWTDLGRSWDEHIAKMRDHIDDKEAEHDLKSAQRAAEDAAAYASYVIDYTFAAGRGGGVRRPGRDPGPDGRRRARCPDAAELTEPGERRRHMIVTSPIDEFRAWTRSQTEAVSKGWWVLLLTGVVGIVAGAAIVFIDWTVDDLVVFVGTLLIVRGAFTMFSIPVDGSLRTWSIALGLVEIFVGIGVFAWPGPALLVVALSIGWLLLFREAWPSWEPSAAARSLPLWGLVLVAGVLEVVVAIYLLGRPGLTLVATVLAIGFATVLYGVLEVVAAFEVENLPQRFDQLTGQVDGSRASRPLEPVGSPGA